MATTTRQTPKGVAPDKQIAFVLWQRVDVGASAVIQLAEY